MSRIKANNLTPFSGGNINFGGHAVPSGSDKNLGSESNPWKELYVSSGSVNFVGSSFTTVAIIKAGGESGVNAQIPSGMVFIDTVGTTPGSTLRGSFSIGRTNRALGTASLAVGLSNTASGNYSYAQGQGSVAFGLASHAEGSSEASGSYSHSEGIGSRAYGYGSHAEGNQTTASGQFSHAEGQATKAIGQYSHAEGETTIASGNNSHAEGLSTLASGLGSHAEGRRTTSSGQFSHAGGLGTISAGTYQTVFGRYNVENNTTSLFVIGAGSGSITDPVGEAFARKDGFSVELDNDNARPHIVIPTNTGNPTNPKAGSMYFNASTNLMYMYNGTAWRSASFA
jgi:hypothetical protein